MNQQRFDDLTRALATTQLSRWQVLKGLSTVLVSTALGLTFQPRRASAS